MRREPAVKAEFDKLQLAREIRRLREQCHLSQAQLAELVGTKQPAIARLESGRTGANLDLLQRIAHAVGRRVVVEFRDDR